LEKVKDSSQKYLHLHAPKSKNIVTKKLFRPDVLEKHGTRICKKKILICKPYDLRGNKTNVSEGARKITVPI